MKCLALIVLVAACGSKRPPEAKPDHEAEHHEENMSPELAKFHDVLAPHWHAAKGTERMSSTCSAIPEFQQRADALVKASPPVGSDAAAWSAGTKALTDAVAGLKGACDAADATAFEAAFERVHKGFHGLLEGGEHHM
jgi:hypothetical protein